MCCWLCVELSWAELSAPAYSSHQLFTCFQFSSVQLLVYGVLVCWCIVVCVLCFLFLLGDLNISIVAAVNLVGNIVSTLQYRLWYFLYFNLTLFQCVCVCVWYSIRVYISLSKSFLPKINRNTPPKKYRITVYFVRVRRRWKKIFPTNSWSIVWCVFVNKKL